MFHFSIVGCFVFLFSLMVRPALATYCADDIALAADGPRIYALEHFESETLADLRALIRMETVSEALNPSQMRPHAEEIAKTFRAAGLENVELLTAGTPEAPSMPFICADWLHAGEDAPTVFLYAHYDVKPATGEELAQWNSSPFSGETRNDRLYGRGATDNKSAIALVLSAVRSYLKIDGKLPINLKIVVEGEEEVGSTHLESFIVRHPERVNADVIYVADAGNYSETTPGLGIAARGFIGLNVKLSASHKPGHSGVYGGAVPNTQIELARLIGTLNDERGRLSVPHLLDRVRPPQAEEQALISAFLPTREEYRAEIQLLERTAFLDQGQSLHPFLLPAYFPSVSVGDILTSGGGASQIPSYSRTKLAIRLVADMDVNETIRLVTSHLQAQNRHGLQLEIESEGSVSWWRQSADQPDVRAAAMLMEHVYGTPTQFYLDGGTVPLLAMMATHQPGKPIIYYGAWDPLSDIHAPNENVHLPTLQRTLESTILMWREMADRPVAN